MSGNPELPDGFLQSLLRLVWYDTAFVPPCTTVEHVKQSVSVDEYQICLDFNVEFVWQVDVHLIRGSSLCPLAADPTGAADFWDQA